MPGPIARHTAEGGGAVADWMSQGPTSRSHWNPKLSHLQSLLFGNKPRIWLGGVVTYLSKLLIPFVTSQRVDFQGACLCNVMVMIGKKLGK